MGLNFETLRFRGQLSPARYVCKLIMPGADIGPHQPVERGIQLSRAMLTVLAKCRQSMSIVTKGVRIAHDVDLLSALAKVNGASVVMSLTMFDELKRALKSCASRRSPAM